MWVIMNSKDGLYNKKTLYGHLPEDSAIPLWTKNINRALKYNNYNEAMDDCKKLFGDNGIVVKE